MITNKARIERSAEYFACKFVNEVAEKRGFVAKTLPDYEQAISDATPYFQQAMDEACEAPTPQVTDAAECAEYISAICITHSRDAKQGCRVGLDIPEAAATIQVYADSQVDKAREEVKRLREALERIEGWANKSINDANVFKPDDRPQLAVCSLIAQEAGAIRAALNPTESVG